MWLPKLIIDGHQEKLQKQGNDSLRNDGLVTVGSAKWGNFLGVLEGCDHWDVRGAGGLSAHIDDGSEKADMGGSEENKWSWSDWQRFFGAWDQGKTKRDAKKEPTTTEPTTEQEKRVERAKVVRTLEDSDAKHKMVDEARARAGSGAEDGNGSSTMDNILDWVVDNVPGVGTEQVPLKMAVEHPAAIPSSNKKVPNGEQEQVKPPRFDLERFYVALSRKLYDEGL